MTTAAAEDRERVGPYRVIQAIGAGGSARIDLARIDRAYGFQRHVVIKRPLEHLRANLNVAASLRREARIGGQLRHPNLVAILDAGVHDGYDYLVLEYVHGAALRTVMQTDAPGRVRELPLAVALAIVTDVARGMHEAHELTDDGGAPLGLVHRDVSPGNILLGLDGTVKLADFGIAKETRISTLSGSMHGTVTYMAPEQCQGHAFDRRADVFSLGVILYELVTGTRLFWADNDVASLHRVLSGAVPRPRKLKPQLPSALEDILLIAVAHDASERFPTALELAGALEAYAAQAGEVLGARWIARTMEDVVGARQVPWIAAATAPEAGPRGDGSLVDLIAAAGPDEPASTSFGDADEVPAPEAEPVSAPSEPPRERPGSPSVASPGTRTGRPRWHSRTLVATVVALAAFGGSAAIALVITRGSRQPAAIAPATSAPPAAPDTTPAGPQASPAVQATRPAPGPRAPEPPSPAATPAPADIAAPAAPPTDVAKKRRPPRSTRAVPRTTVGARGRAHDPDRTDTAGSPGPGPAPGSGSAAAEPSARPPANVEWKPTLLLPTDGSGARAPK